MAGTLTMAGLLLAAGRAQAQSSPSTRDSVLTVVQQFFQAMEAKDTVRLHAIMVTSGHTLAVISRNDTTRISVRPGSEFITNLPGSSQHWRERIWEPQVLIHETLAVVWAPYDFYLDSTFSHCGVDSFTLVRLADGWKIVDAAFTIEPVGCTPSPLGPRT